MKTLKLIAALFLVIGMTSCQKEELLDIDVAVDINLNLEAESDKRFISVNKFGITKALTATEAKTTDNEILYVWDIDADKNEVLVFTPNHKSVAERYPEVEGVTFKGATELRDSPVVAGEIEELRNNGSKEKMKDLFDQAAPLADIGATVIKGEGGGVCALMPGGHYKLIWEVVYDEQGRILYQNVVGIYFGPFGG